MMSDVCTNIKLIHLIEFELQGRVDTVLYTDKSVDKGSHRKSWAGDMDMKKYLNYLPSSFMMVIVDMMMVNTYLSYPTWKSHLKTKSNT